MITCSFEDGGTGLLRHVTVNAIIFQDNKILLGKRGTYNGGKPLLEGGKWALIGGFVGRDEDLQQALSREIKEEIGSEIKSIKLFHIKDNPDRASEDRQNIEFVFMVEIEGEPVKTDEEVSNLQWFELDKLPSKDQIAFDHGDDVELFKIYVNEKITLPVIGKYRI